MIGFRRTSLPPPAFDASEAMSLAIFMVGGYQEMLDNMHNLFGDADAWMWSARDWDIYLE